MYNIASLRGYFIKERLEEYFSNAKKFFPVHFYPEKQHGIDNG